MKLLKEVCTLSIVIDCGSVRKTIISAQGNNFAMSSANFGLTYAAILVTETMIIPKNIISSMGLAFAISTKRKEKIINQMNEYTGKIIKYLKKYINLLRKFTNFLSESNFGISNKFFLDSCLW